MTWRPHGTLVTSVCVDRRGLVVRIRHTIDVWHREIGTAGDASGPVTSSLEGGQCSVLRRASPYPRDR